MVSQLLSGDEETNLPFFDLNSDGLRPVFRCTAVERVFSGRRRRR